MTQPHILLVEDEPAIADTLCYALRTEGFNHTWTASGTEARLLLKKQCFDLVVLDVGLPDANGFDLCRELRTHSPTPVLFLTARQSEIDRIVGLEIGGDDYVTKPFSPREITARIRAILRRCKPSTEATIPRAGGSPNETTISESDAVSLSPARPDTAGRTDTAGTVGTTGTAGTVGTRGSVKLWLHDEARKRIQFKGKPLNLTRNEYRLLLTFLRRPGRVFSREELLQQAWDDPLSCTDRTVDAHVKQLRAKLRECCPEFDPIETHRGSGYALKEDLL